MKDAPELNELIENAARGDDAAREEIVSRYRDRLQRILRLRRTGVLPAGIDESALVDESLGAALDELSDFLGGSSESLFVWLRGRLLDRLVHAASGPVDSAWEPGGQGISLHRGALPIADSLSLAEQLLGTMSAPSSATLRVERRVLLQEALNAMDADQREILMLRHLEGLTMAEVAEVLGIPPARAMAQHVRALKKLRARLDESAGFFDDYQKKNGHGESRDV